MCFVNAQVIFQIKEFGYGFFSEKFPKSSSKRAANVIVSSLIFHTVDVLILQVGDILYINIRVTAILWFVFLPSEAICCTQ